MQLPDALIESYYTLLTDLPPEQYRPLIAAKPRDAKVALAKHLITWLHSATDADAAERGFVAATHHQIPDDIPEMPLGGRGPFKIAPLLVRAGFVASNGEGMRKVKEGAIKLDGEKVADVAREYTFDGPAVLQMGSRKFVRLTP